MRKKMTTVLAALLFISLLGFSQNPAVSIYWGKLNTLESHTTVHLLGKRGNNLLGYVRSHKTVSIVEYSYDDLHLSGEATIIGKESSGNNVIPKDYTFDQMLFLKDKVYVCVTQFDKSTKSNDLYMEEFGADGSLVGGLKKVISISAKNKVNKGDFDFVVSKDSTKFLLVDVPPFEKYSGEKFGFQIFDENLNQIDNAEISLPNNFKYFIVPLDQISLSNDGIVYMLAKNIKQKEDKSKGDADYYFQLLAINPHGQGDVTTYDLKLPQKAITDIAYNVEDSNYIICSGFYGNVKNTQYSSGQIDGIFYFRINKKTKGIESTGLKALDHDFIADITSQKSANKGKGLSNNFTLVHFVKRSDGGALLVSEYRDTYTVTEWVTTPNGGSHMETHTIYARSNIIVININTDGSIKWYVNIPKKQTSEDDGGIYSSFFMGTHGSKMYFVYNENPLNLGPNADEKNIKVMSNPYKATAILVELSESGTFDKTPLFKNKDNSSVIEPQQALKINDGEFIVPAVSVKSACCFFKAPNPKKYTLARFDFQ